MCKPIETGHQSATISSVICKSFAEVFSVVVHIRLTKTWKTFCLHSWRCDRESQTVIQTRKTWINEQSLPGGPGWYPLPPRLGAKAFSCRPKNQWCFWDGFIQQARIIHMYIYIIIHINIYSAQVFSGYLNSFCRRCFSIILFAKTTPSNASRCTRSTSP